MDSKTSVSIPKQKTSDKKPKVIKNSIAVQKPIVRISDPAEIIRRIHDNPDSLTRQDAMILQNTIGNRAVIKLLASINKRKDLVKKEDDENKDKSPELSSPDKIENGNDDKKAVDKTSTKTTEDNNQLQENKDEIKPQQKTEAPDEKASREKPTEINVKEESDKQPQKEAEKDNLVPDAAQGKQAAEEAKPDEQKETKESENNDVKTSQEQDKEPENDKPVEEKAEPAQESAQEEKHEEKQEKVAAADNVQETAGKEEAKKAPQKKRSVKIHAEDPAMVLEQLESISPADVMNAFPEAVSVSKGALEKQKQKTENTIPEIPAPTGIQSGVAEEGVAAKNVKPIDHDVPDGFKSEQSGGEACNGMPDTFNSSSDSDGEEDSDAIMKEARECAAQAPTIGMTGEADPSQVSGFKSESANSMQAAQKQELSQTNNDFGENNICPQPDNTILKSEQVLQEVVPPSVEFGHEAYVPDNIAADFNKTELAPMLKSQLESRKNEYLKDKTKFDGNVLAAKADTDNQIEQMKSDAREKQLNEQDGAKAEVNNLRGEWRDEVSNVTAEYDQNANAASEEKKQEIAGIKEEKEGQVQETMANAEKDAQKEHKSAKAEAEDKKKEGKKDDRNIFQKAWDWTKEKAQQFADGIKKAVNFVFTKLRQAVKAIFDKAKQLAVGLIEAGRKLIVTAIKGLGKVLKGFVKVAFSKFPGIANKICSKIDNVVNKAVKTVNRISDGLKKGVTTALDFLSKSADKFLGTLQSSFNSIMSGIGKFLKGDFRKLFGKFLEGLQIAAEIAAAFATGGGSILIQIGIWLGTTLPGLFQKAAAVMDFVNNIKGIRLDDVKQFLTPGKIGDFLVKGLFGELRGLPQGGKEEKEKEKDKEPAGGQEGKGLLKVLHILSSVAKTLKGVYEKVAGGINKILSVINITSKPWFNPFSMIYAGAVKAMEIVQNPAESLNDGVGKLKESIGEFFSNIKGKVMEVSGGIKEKVMLIGKPAQLMKLLANKAVDMVLNFIITHPPSALIKAAFKIIESASGQSIIDLVRQHIPFADKLINKIAESGPVQGLMKPLQKPVNYVGGVIDDVTERAVGMVDDSEQKALGAFGSGEKLLKGLTGGAGGGGKKQGNAKGGGDFLGSIKGGIHTRLMAYGLGNIKQGGKNLIKAGANKAASAVRKLLTPKLHFRLGNEDHELWVEQGKNRNVVMMASAVGSEMENNEDARRVLEKNPELKNSKRILENEKNDTKVTSEANEFVAKTKKASTGVNEAGKSGNDAKYLDQVAAIVALMEKDKISKDCSFEEAYDKYSKKGKVYKYSKKEIAGAYYKYTGKTNRLNDIDYPRILKDDGRPVTQDGVKEGEVKNHAHHINYKLGQEGTMNDIAMKGHEILRKYNIDPVLDPHNLVSAPNTGHSEENIAEVYNGLAKTEAEALEECKGLIEEEKNEYVRDALYKELERLGLIAQSRSRKKKGGKK